jgi:uncharacterized membrane protein (DUF373 family)
MRADYSNPQQPNARAVNVQYSHPALRKYLELTQDVIVMALCAMLFVAMAVKLIHLGRLTLAGIDFSLVMADVLFILVLLELFRLLLIYLEEHRVSVSTMVEVGIVSTLREVIARGALQIDWPLLLVLSVFVLSLALVLRYAGIRTARTAAASAGRNSHVEPQLTTRRAVDL